MMRKPYKKADDIVDAIYTAVSEVPREALMKREAGGRLPKPRRAWLPRMPQFQDASQQKAFGNILKFMALVLVFTLVARGAAGATLAKVDAVAPYPGEVIEYVSANGTVQAAASLPVDAPAGLTIQEVPVAPGQAVKAGDVVAVLDADEVAEGRERARLALEDMELNLQKLERGEAYDGSGLVAAQNALAWAEQDYTNTQTAGSAAVAAAQTALDEAKSALDALRKSAAAAPPPAGSDPAAPDAPDDSAPPAPAGPSPADIAAAEANVAAAQTALDNAVRDADTALQGAARAVETARLNLGSAQMGDTEARRGAEDAAAQNALDAEALRLDIAKQLAAIAAYDAVRDGTLNAVADGIVLEVAEAGAVTGEAPVALIAGTQGGFIATADIPRQDAAKLASGAQVDVFTSQSYYGMANQSTGVLLSVSEPSVEGMARVRVRLPEGEWKQGEAVQLAAVLSRQNYQSCVPLSALGQGPEGYFVYVMEERSGVLGTENVVRQVPVTLLAHDASVAAVEGAIFGGMRVISWASKPLADGDKVRVRQA